jgi:RNA ligase
MFPIIETLDDIVPHIAANKQIRVKPDDFTGLTIVCYMVQDEDTFAGTDLQFAVECRGLTFHPDGRIAARTLHKFFNIGEHESVRPENLMWGQVDRIMEKRDGSMVTPVKCGDSILFKTKKTFSSKEAMLAGDIAFNTMGAAEWLASMIEADLTPTFEMTSPKYPIVIKYEKDELTLLHIRENVTGRYLTEAEIFATNPPFPVVPNLKDKFTGLGLPANLVSWEILKERQENAEGLEGWVVQFTSGEMIKIKTAWYVALHHSVTFTRWRDIARSVVADQSDDLKGAFAMTGRSIQPIIDVERRIKARIEFAREAAQQIVDTFAAVGVTDAKGLAMVLNKHEHFGLIMRTFRQQEIDWMAWYAKTHLEDDFGLEVVGDDA